MDKKSKWTSWEVLSKSNTYLNHNKNEQNCRVQLLFKISLKRNLRVQHLKEIEKKNIFGLPLFPISSPTLVRREEKGRRGEWEWSGIDGK